MIDTETLLSKTWLAHAEHHLELDSTQIRARAIANQASGERIPLPALVVADRQTAGRGRGSNRWWTGQESLAFSLLVDPQQFGFPRKVVPRLSLAVGVALVDALAPRLADHPLGLHWPNDIYVGRGKLAGILVEVLPDGLHIIGVGVNSNNTAAAAPPELRESIATLLDLTGRPHDHTELLAAILKNTQAALHQLSQPVEILGARFDMLCRQRGETLTVYQGEKTITGRCAGIGVDGSLLLDTAAGRVAMQSGTLRPANDKF
jgi:BirA family transcriptional regulator, biotin operon repressor / biotin---[acetyl-CoA-carboxylase] ligase